MPELSRMSPRSDCTKDCPSHAATNQVDSFDQICAQYFWRQFPMRQDLKQTVAQQIVKDVQSLKDSVAQINLSSRPTTVPNEDNELETLDQSWDKAGKMTFTTFYNKFQLGYTQNTNQATRS
jgi:hypothetical protein